MYSELIMMCNVIMTLYDAVVERRAGSISCKLLFTRFFAKMRTWRLKKISAGWVYRVSEKSGVKLSTNRKISTHKRTPT